LRAAAFTDWVKRMPRLLILLAFLTCALVAPTAALAGGPGDWTRLSPPTQSSGDQPGYSRTDEDVLHVLWEASNPTNANHPDLFHSSITLNGTFQGSNPVETNWDTLSPPALVTAADGVTLDAFFGGIRTTAPSETNNELNQSESQDRGEEWGLVPGTVAPHDAEYASDMSATRLGNVFWQAWGGTGHGAFAHRGTSAATPNVDLQARVGGGCCGYNANIVADPHSNRVFAVWYSNASTGLGVWLQELNSVTSAPIGAPVRMPGTVVSFGGSKEAPALDDRTPAAVRSTGGVWVAYPGGYPSRTRVLLWHVGQTKSRRVALHQSDVVGTALSATNDGRLWVAWSAKVGGKRRILARRSNKTASRFGRAVVVKPPKSIVDAVYADANPSGSLDLLVMAQSSPGSATYHSQVRPGLTLKAPKKLKRKKKTKAKFRVLDAGVPVAGAKVKVGGKTKTTGSEGRATIKLGPFGKKKKSVVAKASRDGYSPAKKKIKIKKK
jgi:hypothetical protein